MCDIGGLQCVCTVVRSSSLPAPPPTPKVSKGARFKSRNCIGWKSVKTLGSKICFSSIFLLETFPTHYAPTPPPKKKNVDFFFLDWTDHSTYTTLNCGSGYQRHHFSSFQRHFLSVSTTFVIHCGFICGFSLLLVIVLAPGAFISVLCLSSHHINSSKFKYQWESEDHWLAIIKLNTSIKKYDCTCVMSIISEPHWILIRSKFDF